MANGTTDEYLRRWPSVPSLFRLAGFGNELTSKPESLQTHSGARILHCSCSPTTSHTLTVHWQKICILFFLHSAETASSLQSGPHTPQDLAAQHHSSTTCLTCFLCLLHTKKWSNRKFLFRFCKSRKIYRWEELNECRALWSPSRKEPYIRVTNTKYSGRDQQQEDFIWF